MKTFITFINIKQVSTPCSPLSSYTIHRVSKCTLHCTCIK